MTAVPDASAMTITTDTETIDPEAVAAFAGRVFGAAVGGGITLLVDVGHRAGLFDAAAGAGPLTSAQLADRVSGSERHVREWLGGMTTAGVFTYDSATATYELPAAHAAVLTGNTSSNIAPMAAGLALLAAHVPAVADTIRHGGGIPYDAYRPAFTTCMDQIMRRIYDDAVLDGYVAAVPGLPELLTEGALVADIGCGTGHTTNLLARAFPTSTFVGLDIATDAIQLARGEAADWGLTNVRFEVADVAELDGPYDVVVAFDCIHDQARPADVLAAVRRALTPDGLFMAVDVGVSSHLEENLMNPIAPYFFTTSLFHCMQVSLADGGAGLGACWGRQTATRMVADAGFESVTLLETPAQDPMNVIIVGRASQEGSTP